MTSICFGIVVSVCQALGGQVPSDSYCQLTRPIYWHSTDTRKTKEQIDIHNRKWKVLCGRGP
jgi:hypothetical protein